MTVLAICCHPDDMEMMMGGTLLLLKQAGCAIHTINIANGCVGSAEHRPQEIAAIRWAEAQASAARNGFIIHESLVDDLGVFYEQTLIKRVTALVRKVKPDLVFTQSLEDYMEDHTNTCRLTVTAAFARGMRNFAVEPAMPPVATPVTVYHALPYGLRDGLRRAVTPDQYVNIGTVLATKRAALACHRSQKEWLDKTQGVDSYLDTMESMSQEVGRWSTVYPYAEGWRRHSHLGFCDESADPLTEALGDKVLTSVAYERELKQDPLRAMKRYRQRS